MNVVFPKMAYFEKNKVVIGFLKEFLSIIDQKLKELGEKNLYMVRQTLSILIAVTMTVVFLLLRMCYCGYILDNLLVHLLIIMPFLFNKYMSHYYIVGACEE